jgi:hypothetical protein
MNNFTSDEDEEAAVFFHQSQQRPRKKREVLPYIISISVPYHIGVILIMFKVSKFVTVHIDEYRLPMK